MISIFFWFFGLFISFVILVTFVYMFLRYPIVLVCSMCVCLVVIVLFFMCLVVLGDKLGLVVIFFYIVCEFVWFESCIWVLFVYLAVIT